MLVLPIFICAIGASGIESSGLCVIEPSEGGVNQYLREDENLRRIPIPFVVNKMQFYIEKSTSEESRTSSVPVSIQILSI